MSTIVPIDQIPNEVMEELHCEFRSVSFSDYGTPTRGTNSKRLVFHITEPLVGVERIADPHSFDEMFVDDSSHCWHTRYMARGYFKGRIADVRALYAIRIVVPLY